MGSTTPDTGMGAVLTSIPLCSRAGEAAGAQEPADNRPEDRQVTVLTQPQSVQSHTSETCLDNENHEEQENTNQIENPDQLNASVKEESSLAVQEEEDDGNVEVNLDDSQTDEWCLDKEVELDSEVNEREEKEEEKEEREEENVE